MKKEEAAADSLTSAVQKKLGETNRNKIFCPRERSFMTPCVARDGALAVADNGICAGCSYRPTMLLKSFLESQKP